MSQLLVRTANSVCGNGVGVWGGGGGEGRSKECKRVTYFCEPATFAVD